MTRNAKYLVLLLLLPLFGISQLRVIKPVKIEQKKARIGIGMGYARSVLYLTRNVNNNNDARGFNSIITYEHGNFMRGSLEFTYFGSINIKPTWLNVRAQTTELNISFLSKSKSNTFYFYPIAGISYNVFKGYYTGVNDFLNLSSIYPKNANVRTTWLGVNVGCGVDFNIKNFSVYGNCKMRIGRTEGYDQVNIMDVFMATGIVYNIPPAAIYKVFRGTRSRYILDTKKPSQ